MNYCFIFDRPSALEAILRETDDLGFSMACEPQTGSLLRTLAAAKPAGRFLELGTGTGVATAWLLAGMDQASRLETVDHDPAVVAIARRHLGGDSRVTFHLNDGAVFIERHTPASWARSRKSPTSIYHPSTEPVEVREAAEPSSPDERFTEVVVRKCSEVRLYNQMKMRE